MEEVSPESLRGGGRGNEANLGVMSPLATNDGDDVTRIELCLRGLGGGIGRSLFSSPLSAESESFFSNGSFDFDPEEAAKSSSTSFPSDLDLRCMGRGGAIGLRSEDVLPEGVE